MHPSRPSLARRILHRIFPFPLVRAQEQRLANLESALAQMSKSLEDSKNHILKKIDLSRWQLRDSLLKNQPAPKELTCLLCGHRAPVESFREKVSECIFGGGKLVRHECPVCEAVFGPQKMLQLTPEELGFEYRELYGYYKETDSTDSEIRAFRSLNPRKDGVYLNYGAGAWSNSLKTLRREGYQVFAYEPHVDTPTEHLIQSEERLKSMRFDGIYSNNVIEHFDNPVEAFRLMASVLKGPQARMAHASPCYDYTVEFTRFHLIFFTGKSPEVLARLAGLQTDGRDRDESGPALYICQRFKPA